MQAVETLSVSQHVPVENLVKLGLLPGAKDGHFYSQLREMLLPMKCDPVVALLTLQEPQASLEQLFERAETENTAEVCTGVSSQITFTETVMYIYKILFKVKDMNQTSASEY